MTGGSPEKKHIHLCEERERQETSQDCQKNYYVKNSKILFNIVEKFQIFSQIVKIVKNCQNCQVKMLKNSNIVNLSHINIVIIIFQLSQST